MQCEETPWDVWGKLGKVKFFKAPTPEEMIVAYYSSQSIEVSEVAKVETNMATCQACSVCPMSYSFMLKTKTENVDRLKATGWKFKT